MTHQNQLGIPAAVRGTYEEGRRLLGVPSAMNIGPFPVSSDRIAAFCALIEDSNPSYWHLATSGHGRNLVAPPAMLQAWTLSLPWMPLGSAPKPRLMLLSLPLPGRTLINVSTDIVYDRPLYVGEFIHFYDMATAISDEKETRLGRGRFVTTVCYIQSSKGDSVATITNVHFRYDPRGGA